MTEDKKNLEQGETVIIPRRQFSEASAEAEALSEIAGAEGDREMAAGLEALAEAQEMADAEREVLASGASSVTRGVDAMAASERSALLSEAVGVAGVRDVAQGAELLTASDDLAEMSGLIAAMSTEDLERGMDLASLFGELTVASDIMEALDMPVMAAFLADRGQWLREIAVDELMQYGTQRLLAEAMGDTGVQVADLGAGEVEEGI
ncbi:MAG: hypothetical protein ACK2U2_15645, partial [Anaerolineae bacterium]